MSKLANACGTRFQKTIEPITPLVISGMLIRRSFLRKRIGVLARTQVRPSGDIRPAGRNVDTGQSIQVLPFGSIPTVREEQPRSFLVPFCKGAYWN